MVQVQAITTALLNHAYLNLCHDPSRSPSFHYRFYEFPTTTPV
jgi:hypothetical protein